MTILKHDLKDFDYVKGLQQNLRSSLETPQGQEVMRFLEALVGYDASIYDPTSKENTWVRDGARQVVATLKSLMKHKAEDIVALAKSKEE
jgi:protein-tyrosine-phosphatase|tara:strand:+ start:283 stop:552 length:270 start_codon:yes stop_codon:yes gene_type:complete